LSQALNTNRGPDTRAKAIIEQRENLDKVDLWGVKLNRKVVTIIGPLLIYFVILLSWTLIQQIDNVVAEDITKQYYSFPRRFPRDRS
jgi:hypothetical protein